MREHCPRRLLYPVVLVQNRTNGRAVGVIGRITTVLLFASAAGLFPV